MKTLLFVMANLVHHDKRIWKNPDDFDPSRFDHADNASRHQMQCGFLGFGRGQRVCIGDKIFWYS